MPENVFHPPVRNRNAGRTCRRLAAATGLWLATALTAPAQTPDEPGDPNVPQQLQDVEKQLDTVTTRTQDLEKTAEELAAETEALSKQLIAIASKIQAREAQITASETRLKKLAFEEDVMRDQLRERRDALAELLAGLQRLERNPPPPLAVNPTDALAALRGAMLLGSVVPELRGQASSLVQNLSRLTDLRAAIVREQGDVTENLGKLDGERRQIAHLLQQKQTLTQTIRQELESERKRANTLAERAKSLKDLIAKLEQAREEAEKARQAAEKAAANELEIQRKLRLARLMKPAVPFSRARGKLYFPAQGTRVRKYGSKDALGGTAKGLSIATRAFAQVTAPNDGRVAYAGEFRGYGQLLIINAGEGYHVLLAGMENITVDVGQFVRAGEPVGTMGGQAALSTVIGIRADDPRPVLYVEFRKNGNAIDPRPWWAGNDEKVRG
ncbi:MAG: murein hydrolase activator EnvC family protein [Hyphomicrobiales bacterium]